jgi:flavin-binding protein dodecin
VSQIVTEIRKGAILIAACEGKTSPAFQSAIADAISTAEEILARIDWHRPDLWGEKMRALIAARQE